MEVLEVNVKIHRLERAVMSVMEANMKMNGAIARGAELMENLNKRIERLENQKKDLDAELIKRIKYGEKLPPWYGIFGIASADEAFCAPLPFNVILYFFVRVSGWVRCPGPFHIEHQISMGIAEKELHMKAKFYQEGYKVGWETRDKIGSEPKAKPEKPKEGDGAKLISISPDNGEVRRPLRDRLQPEDPADGGGSSAA